MNSTPTARAQVIISFHPRANAFVWAYQPPQGKAPQWRDGKPTLDATKTQAETLVKGPVLFTVQNA